LPLDEANQYLTDQQEKVPSLNQDIASLKELSNPMQGWSRRFLKFEEGAEVPVGAEVRPKPGTLYWSYLLYCQKYGVTAERPRSFSNCLLGQLHS